MKKKITLIISLILLVTMVISLPFVFELVYLKNKTVDSLHILCEVSSFFKKDKLVLDYYPKLVFNKENDEILTDTEKDDLLFTYLETAVNIDNFEEQKNILKKAYLEFSGIESATIGSTSFIYSYYEKTNDKKKCYELFEVLLDVSSSKNYEFKNGIYTKYIEFLINNNEIELLKKTRTERINFLKNNGVNIWDDEEQSPQLGDGAIINQSE